MEIGHALFVITGFQQPTGSSLPLVRSRGASPSCATMGLVDPFSAASKPMPDWDTIPSRPLPFAATLHALDLNAPCIPRLPRPLRSDYEELPKVFPSPPYRHGQHGSQTASLALRHDGPSSPSWRLPRGKPGSDEWMESMVANCVDNAKCDLDLSGCGLETISTNIRDLRDLVTLAVKSPSQCPSPASSWAAQLPRAETSDQHPRQRLRGGERQLARTQSAPASAAFFARVNEAYSDLSGSPRGSLLPAPQIEQVSHPSVSTGRRFTRSKTGTASVTRTQPAVGVSLGGNRLISDEPFNHSPIGNNQLRALPAAIGDLVHLKELNISNNLIDCLPSTIIDLEHLEVFSCDPNPWLPQPSAHNQEELQVRRTLGPLQRFQESSVPRLAALCMIVLLSPRLPSNLPPFMSFDWDAHRINGKHPLLDVEGLQREILPAFSLTELRRILQAVKSGCDSGTDPRRASRRTAFDRFPASHGVPPPDDASTNMYYYPCPSPRHLEYDEDSREEPLPRRVFLHPAEERIEWRTVAGVKGLPIRWLGCSPGCLTFLEEEEEEDWPLEGCEGESAWE
ncbi:unnamed protein product [Cutaneotrichosporon oleaginosum]